jgi:hypothetical protein
MLNERFLLIYGEVCGVLLDGLIERLLPVMKM